MSAGLMAGLYGDADMAALIGPQAQVRAMLRVEAALARAQADLGLIPAAAARAIAATAAALDPDPAALAEGAARAGIAAQPVLAALTAALPDAPARDAVHLGATSQDIVDSALSAQLIAALDLLRARLAALDAALARQAADHADRPIAARTRHRIAAPTTLGAKIAVWRGMAARHLDRLAELEPRVLVLSLHGAVGTGTALGGRADDLRRAMAADLGLRVPDGPWHAARDGVAELAGWLSLVSGLTGKIGLDLLQLGQSEMDEVRAGTGGGSSAMPQKVNPVAAEALVSLARLNAGDLAGMHHALIHAQERDGTALGLEWDLLPRMLERTAAALRLANDLVVTLRPVPDRIAATFAADRGRMTAETAAVLLARDRPRGEARAIVARALARMDDDPGLTLAAALDALAPGRDWAADLDPRHPRFRPGGAD